MAPQVGCTDPATALDCLAGAARGAAVPTQRGCSSGRVRRARGADRTGRPPTRRDFHRVPCSWATRDEHRGFVGLFYDLAGTPVTAEQYPVLLANAFGDKADEIAARVPLSPTRRRAPPGRRAHRPRVATATTTLTDQLATHTPVYRYEFADRDAPCTLPFPKLSARRVPRGPGALPVPRPGVPGHGGNPTEELSDTMIKVLDELASTGDPNEADLPVGPGYSPAGHLPVARAGQRAGHRQRRVRRPPLPPLWTE